MTTISDSVNADEIAGFLTGLYGLQVSVAADPGASCDVPGGMASYVDAVGTEKGRILCDLSAAAILGAALTQVPMGVVEEAISAGELPDNLAENVREVLNIAVSLLPGSHHARLVLDTVTTEFADVPSCDGAAALSVDVQRYGSCKLFVMS